MGKKLSNEEFIERSNIIHNNKYDYSNLIYINTYTKINIICPIHGSFNQTPANHLKHNGCNKCGTILSSIKNNSNTDDFIIKANKIHNNKYDYSKVVYKKTLDKIIIICKLHGEFYQTPTSHLKNSGCNKCGKLSNIYKISSNTTDFITKANKIHNNKYDYSKSVYINCKLKICVICKIHGEFNITPDNHIHGTNCSKCIKNGYSKVQIQWLNFLEKYYNINIQHMGNSNQEYKIKNTRWKADGYYKETNTIYEFHGDYWHGNPKCYLETDKNTISNKTMGYLYKKTLEREHGIKKLGYNLVVIWEYDWNKINKSITKLQKRFLLNKS
jgi:hypothetical protein